MRIKFEGKRSLPEIKEDLGTMLNRMELMGIEYVSGCNFYFNPEDEDGTKIDFYSDEGETNIITGWTQLSRRKARKKKAKTAEVIRLAVDNEKNG
jgi:hypothetical protein